LIYLDNKADNNAELAVLEKVLKLILSPPFKDFLGGRMNK